MFFQSILILKYFFQTFVVFAGLLALAAGVPIPDDVVAVPALVAAPEAVPTFNLAPTLIRAPAHDSASIESHRLGGNFAYAVAEAHAFAQVTPQVSTLTHPVAETTYVHEPATIAKVVPGAVTTTQHIPHPIILYNGSFASLTFEKIRAAASLPTTRPFIFASYSRTCCNITCVPFSISIIIHMIPIFQQLSTAFSSFQQLPTA